VSLTRNLRDGELKIKDGGSEEITVALDEGDLTISETQNLINVLDRGTLDHRRQGDEAPVAVSVTLKFVEYIGGSGQPATPYEALKQIGNASGWVSTSNSDVYAVDLEFTIDDPDGGDDEKISLNDFAFESIEFAEGDEYNTLTVDGTAFVTGPTLEKVA
jgi:hypothetical protein